MASRIAVVLLAGLLGGACSTQSSGTPAPSATASTTQPATTSSAPPGTPMASPASAAGAACVPGPVYAPGTYHIRPDQSGITAPLEVTMTDGWKGCGVSFKDLGDNGIMLVAFWTVGNVYRDPCRWKNGLYDPTVGPSVDDLVKALVDQSVTEATATPFSLDGYTGQHVHMAVPDNAALTGCDVDGEPSFRLWDDANSARTGWRLFADSAAGLQGDAWILDVDGERVVIQGASLKGALPADQAEITEIVQSVNFNP